MKRNDDAVSPVIGVILMVAITVILAAVIAAFVFGLVGNIGGAKVVGMTTTINSSNSSEIDILWQGGADLASLQDISGTVNGTSFGPVNVTPSVGSISTIGTEGTIEGRVVLVGEFSDGSEQILLDKGF
jgi:flagellin-like protein